MFEFNTIKHNLRVNSSQLCKQNVYTNYLIWRYTTIKCRFKYSLCHLYSPAIVNNKISTEETKTYKAQRS